MKKRIISLLSALTFVVSLTAVTSVFSGESILYGDVDNDGEVNIIDATCVQRYTVNMMQLDDEAVKRGDVSGEDGLDIIDVTLIRRYDLRMIKRFPAEGPEREVPKVKDEITISFTNNKKWNPVNAYIYNYSTGDALNEWPGVALTDYEINADGYQVYNLTVDVSRYDRVIFNSGRKQTTEIPVTKASSGYSILGRVGKKYYASIYPTEFHGKGAIRTVVMDYPDGYKKKVYIWTPEGYDPADKSKKYSVLYMCDGQNLFGNVANMSGCFWQCQDTVNSLMQNGGDGVIVVGVDNNDDRRVSELTPNLYELDPGFLENVDPSEIPDFKCDIFSGFIVDSVIPYVEANYNVNSVRGIAGSSCGGQAAFYIGMENMDKFSYIGAFSSAFAYFSKECWNNYLSEKDFSGDVPYIYLYTGENKDDNTEQWIYPTAILMDGWLTDNGYPADKKKNVIDVDARHHENYWALYFPEMLCCGLDL